MFLALGSDDLFFLIRQTSISCLSIIIFHWVGDKFFLMLFHSIAEFKCAIELCSTDQVKSLILLCIATCYSITISLRM